MCTPDERALLDFVRGSMLDGSTTVVGPETELFAEKIIDSMNVLRFIGYVEHRLGRRLEDGELVMANFASVRIICDRFLGDATSE